MKLYELSGQLAEVMELVEVGEMPAEAVNDTLEGLEGMLNDKVEHIGHVILNYQADIVAIDNEVKRLTARKKRAQDSIAFLKSYLIDNMTRANVKKVDGQLFNVSLRSGVPIVVVDDEESLAEDYRFPIVTYKVDKTKIKTALKDGREVPGAHLETGKSSVVIK